MYCLRSDKQYMCIVYAVTSSTCVLFRYSQAVHVYCLGIDKQYMCIVYSDKHVYCLGIHKQYMCIV